MWGTLPSCSCCWKCPESFLNIHIAYLNTYFSYINRFFSSGGNGGHAVRGPSNPSRMSTAWQSVNDLIVRQTWFVRPIISVSATFWNINTRDELRVDGWTIWATLLNKYSRNDMAKICSRLNYGIAFNWTLFILLRVGSALSCKTTRNPVISGTRRLVSHLCSRGELHLGSSKQFTWNFPFSECYDSVRLRSQPNSNTSWLSGYSYQHLDSFPCQLLLTKFAVPQVTLTERHPL